MLLNLQAGDEYFNYAFNFFVGDYDFFAIEDEKLRLLDDELSLVIEGKIPPRNIMRDPRKWLVGPCGAPVPRTPIKESDSPVRLTHPARFISALLT